MPILGKLPTNGSEEFAAMYGLEGNKDVTAYLNGRRLPEINGYRNLI